MLLQVSRKMSDVHAGDHICHIYKTDQERDMLLFPFIKNGLEKGEQVLCILDTLDAETLMARLGDWDTVVPYLVSGQLIFLGSEEFYVDRDGFDVSATLDKLCARKYKARAAGFQSLRVISEMSWTLRYTTEFAHLMAYESQLNERLPKSGCMMLCLYDERRFGAKTLEKMVRVHPASTDGEYLCENRAYVVYTHHASNPVPLHAGEGR